APQQARELPLPWGPFAYQSSRGLCPPFDRRNWVGVPHIHMTTAPSATASIASSPAAHGSVGAGRGGRTPPAVAQSRTRAGPEPDQSRRQPVLEDATLRFSISVSLERFDPKADMRTVAAQALELVQIAEHGGFEIAWTPEHHTIEFTIAPNPFT